MTASVVHVLWNGGIGGAQRAVYQLALHQHRAGTRPVALGFGRATGHYCRLAASAGIPVIDFDLASGADLATAVRARRLLRRFAIHHFHVAEPSLILASALIAGARRVYTHRGGLSNYGSRRALRYKLAAPLVRRFDALTGTTQAAAAIERLFGMPTTRVLRTFNGIDFDLLESQVERRRLRAERGLLPDTVVIGTAADLRAWKRIDWLTDAASRLRARSWQVWIVGDGEDRLRLEALAARSSVADRISFLGMQPAVGDWLRAMDVFVMPSGAEESFGNAVVEAMACGLPTLVSADCPAHTEHVTDGRTGFVVADAGQLAARLDELIEAPALRARLGEDGKRFVRERYPISRMVERFETIYGGLDVPRHTRVAG